MTTLIMPMAGNGLRTLHMFDGPKPLLPILNHPMFYWATKNIKVDNKIFIVKDSHVDKYSIDKIIRYFFNDAIILVQQGEKRGPVDSILVAEDYLDNNPIIICDCDMYSEISIPLNNTDIDASILTFNSNLKNYSYVVKEDENIKKIVEKTVIGSEAVGGKFYWKDGKTFLHYAKKTLSSNQLLNNEYYMSSVYNEAIADGINIKSILSKNTYDLSMKEDMNRFTKDNKNVIPK